MYTFLIGMAVIFLFCLFAAFFESSAGQFFVTLIGGTLLVGSLWLCIFWLISLPISAAHADELASEYNVKLYSGFNEMQLEGHIFLLSGTMNERDVVKYWVKDSDGMLKKYWNYMSSSSFYEEDRIDGYLITKTYSCQKNKWFFCWPLATEHKKYEFHIPYGSIYNEFSFQ